MQKKNELIFSMLSDFFKGSKENSIFFSDNKSVALFEGGGVNIPKISRIKKYKLETLNKKTRKYFFY